LRYLSGGNMPNPQASKKNCWTHYANGQTMTGTCKPATMTNGNAGALAAQFLHAANAIMALPNGTQLPITRFKF
jgi:ribosomal protein L35AE/L33A